MTGPVLETSVTGRTQATGMKVKRSRETGTSPEDYQEQEYILPYHYLKREHGTSIPYINLLRQLRELIDPKRGEPVLDAGCGDGRLLSEISGSGAALFGVDRSARALRFAAGFNPGASVCVQDLSSLAFADNSFTTVTLVETLEHINPAFLPKVLSEIKRVLKAGGRLIVTVPTHRHPRPPKHYRHFSPVELEKILEEEFTGVRLMGHDCDLWWYRALVAFGDNHFWLLRAGFNKLLRALYRRHLESCSPDTARRLIAVCTKQSA